MRTIRQAWLLTVAAIGSIPARLGTSLITVISITTVMGVLVAMLALSEGLEKFVKADIDPNAAVVLSRGAQSALDSSLPKTILGSIADKPGIKRDANGKPEVTATVFMFLNAVNRQNQRGTVSLFSVTPEWVTINPEVHIVEGRFFRAGLQELIVSDLVRARFRHFDVGDEVRVRGTPWKIVGAYHSTATALEDSVIGDADTVLAAFPQATFNVVDAVLEPGAFATFTSAVVSDPTLKAEVKTQQESSEDIIKSRRKLLDFISFFLGGLMGLGAGCGALASLYASVDARKVEIATLRAIGFGGLPVVSSVLAEGLLLAVPAALLGAGIDWYLFNKHVVVAAGITFPMAVTPHLVVIALCWALSIALLGGILPSIRAARLPVATAIRAA
jgi:putative ABC transport system permease protein